MLTRHLGLNQSLWHSGKYIVDKQNMGLGSIYANEVWLHVYIYSNPGAH